MTELRPCIVRIPEEIKYALNGMSGDKIPQVIKEAEEHKGYFHKWFDRYWTVGESVMIGGHSAGQMSEIVAIVEYEDGTVHEVSPTHIQFTNVLKEDSARVKLFCGGARI